MPPARIVLAAMLLLAMAPVAGADHQSVGASDAILVAPTETPGAESTSPELYGRGLERQCGGDQDPFCGRLVYNQATSYEQASPPDQDIPLDGWTFDAVFVAYVGTYGLATCHPWCTLPGQLPPEAPHRTTINAEAHAPHPIRLAQPAIPGGEANGWLLPAPDTAILAFLMDEDGVPVSEERLRATVEELQRGWLPEEALAAVCGYTPDADLLIQQAPPGCEVPFRWSGESDSHGACASETYLCGMVTPAWEATFQCAVGAGSCLDTQHPGVQGGWDSPFDSTTDHDVWHFVVAPVPPAAFDGYPSGLEPGFLFETGAPMPFIAHDLDVFEPAPEIGRAHV